jgi:hypothetical protein
MLFRPIFLQIHMHFLNQKTERSTTITNQSIIINKPKSAKAMNNAKILSLTGMPHHINTQLCKGLEAFYKAILQISQKWLATATICQYVTCITC